MKSRAMILNSSAVPIKASVMSLNCPSKFVFLGNMVPTSASYSLRTLNFISFRLWTFFSNLTCLPSAPSPGGPGGPGGPGSP